MNALPENDRLQNDFDVFLQIFYLATVNIEADYFQLPVAGQEDPIYRERVYCYQLYHHLCNQKPKNFKYEIDGELDKEGHPIISKAVGSVKPDFVVHERGVMENNLVVVEVKPINAERRRIKKDINTLCNFILRASYYRAIYLVYGETNGDIDTFRELVSERVKEIPHHSFHLFWHRLGKPAECIVTVPE